MGLIAYLRDQWFACQVGLRIARYDPATRMGYLGLEARGSDEASLRLGIALNDAAWRARMDRG